MGVKNTGDGTIKSARGLRLGGETSPEVRQPIPVATPRPTVSAPRVSEPSIGVPAKELPEPLPINPLPTNTKTGNSGFSPIDFIYKSEARLDKDGNLLHYVPPSNDGGIAEFAGITKRHHPDDYARIASLPIGERAAAARDVLDKYTSPAQKWSSNPAVQALLRDTYFHRGPGGSQAIVNIALGGKASRVGQLSTDQIAKLNAMSPEDAINAISSARQRYEDEVVGVRSNLAKGLSNRFNNAKAFSISHLKNLTG